MAVFSAVIVAGSPVGCSPDLIRACCDDADYVAVADKGADRCMEAGVEPDGFVGDGDSASREALTWAMTVAGDVVTAPAEKDMTDLSMAFDLVRAKATEAGESADVTVLCALGGRLDHELGVLGVCRDNARACAVRLADDTMEAWALDPAGQPEVSFDEVGRTVSAVPLSDGTVISEKGLRWELDHARIEALQDLGVSNRVAVAGATVTCHEGCCLVVAQR